MPSPPWKRSQTLSAEAPEAEAGEAQPDNGPAASRAPVPAMACRNSLRRLRRWGGSDTAGTPWRGERELIADLSTAGAHAVASFYIDVHWL
ncbi:hypothetical protein GCM10010220_66670 [Streptomyces parvulus]|nr:hypothetical protein GCM10010220_66670 [Streptomyces parvulus]